MRYLLLILPLFLLLPNSSGIAAYHNSQANISIETNADSLEKQGFFKTERQKRRYQKRIDRIKQKRPYDEKSSIRVHANWTLFFGLGSFLWLIFLSFTPAMLAVGRFLSLIGVVYGIITLNKIEHADRPYMRQYGKAKIGFVFALLTLGFILFLYS